MNNNSYMRTLIQELADIRLAVDEAYFAGDILTNRDRFQQAMRLITQLKNMGMDITYKTEGKSLYKLMRITEISIKGLFF